MNFIEEIKEKAKQNIKTIVLPEALDIRTLKATEEILKDGFAKVILLGDEDKIKEVGNGLNIKDAQIINPLTSEKSQQYANTLYELRKEKGMTIEQAQELVKNEIYFGMMMLKQNEADGLVAGACHSTADTLRPALQILKTAPGTKIVSSFFIMKVPDCEYGSNGTFVFADCGLIPKPTSEELAEIAIASSKNFAKFTGKEPKVAMLSFSTYGSAKGEDVDRVRNAVSIAKEIDKDLLIDGEMQLDAALVKEVAQLKAKGSKVAGEANVLVFPDLGAGNIGYKLVQRLGKAEAYGPILQGIKKPVNDLSRGCSAEDIVGVVALTCLQAE